MRRLAAFLGAFSWLLVWPTSVLACSGPVPDFTEAIAQARVIAIGRVTHSPSNGVYTIDIERVFRGKVGRSLIVGTALPPTQAAVCQYNFQIGERVALALRDPADLGLFSAGVWWLHDDGSVGTLAVQAPVRTASELIALLHGLPNASAADPRQSPLLLFGLMLLGTAVLARAYFSRSRPNVTVS